MLVAIFLQASVLHGVKRWSLVMSVKERLSLRHAHHHAQCRCGKYCIHSAQYNEDNVGPKALQLKFLKESVGEKLQIENTVSIPYGTIDELLESHYENAGPATVVRQAREIGVSGHKARSQAWKQCR